MSSGRSFGGTGFRGAGFGGTRFGGTVIGEVPGGTGSGSGSPRGARRPRKHALAGDGPIVGRARAALRRAAEQFGRIESVDRTQAVVRTDDGIRLTLSYDPGNYIFSRVYNLTVAAELPETSAVPAGIEVTHRGRDGARFVARGERATSPRLTALNTAVRDRLSAVDLVSARVTAAHGVRSVTVTPLGGSFVWVLLPPVFHATAFPTGEPSRILDLIRSLRDWRPATAPLARG